MKIVIINGSARKGNTLTAINAFIKGASEKNEIEIIEPDKLNIAPCKGCGVCQCSKGCVDKDDTNPTIDKIAEHLILFVDDNPIGTCRYYKKDDSYYFGRLAILKEYRNKNYGGLLLKEAINNLKKENAHKVILNSQLSAKDFYIKHDFLQEGEVFYEEGCPHIKMYLKLGE